MAVPRALHTATLLPDGRLLVAGGLDASQRVFASAEVFDPSDGTWQSTGSMAKPRIFHTATLLPDGKVLVVGGFGGGFDALGSAEVYDPASGEWSQVGGMAVRRAFHTATLLPDGRVLVAGGGEISAIPCPHLRRTIRLPISGLLSRT
jgi:N-acetylneuraminic acid mutarotase